MPGVRWNIQNCTLTCRGILSGAITLIILLIIIIISTISIPTSKCPLSHSIEDSFFHYYLRSNPNVPTTREVIEAMQDKPKSVYFYIHGFESPSLEEAESIRIKDAIIQFTDIDMVILVDWTKESQGVLRYPTVAECTVPMVAAHVKEELLWCNNNLGIPMATVKMAGHSLGAHIMGRSGELLKKASGGSLTVSEMTGLDPAGPLFDDAFPNGTHRLSLDDAETVTCIHTDDTFGTTYRKTCSKHLYPCITKCNYNAVVRHNSVKDMFIGYMNDKMGLTEEELPEPNLFWKFVRYLLGTLMLRYIIIALYYSVCLGLILGTLFGLLALISTSLCCSCCGWCWIMKICQWAHRCISRARLRWGRGRDRGDAPSTAEAKPEGSVIIEMEGLK